MMRLFHAGTAIRWQGPTMDSGPWMFAKVTFELGYDKKQKKPEANNVFKGPPGTSTSSKEGKAPGKEAGMNHAPLVCISCLLS